jgi:hypothetical protein
LTPVAGVSALAPDALPDSPEALPVTAPPANGASAAGAGAIVAAADVASPAVGDLQPDTEELSGEGMPLQLKLVFDSKAYWLRAAAVDGLDLPVAVAGARLRTVCQGLHDGIMTIMTPQPENKLFPTSVSCTAF